MKQICYIQVGTHLKAEINFEIDRELSNGEKLMASKALEELVRTINTNTILNSEEFKNQIIEERRQLLQCFESPIPIYAKEAKNEYGGLNPWYEVTTVKGVILIGWRKRVINIDWSNSDIKEMGNVLFAGEETTGAYEYESVQYIHAWGYDKAKEYIKKLLSQL